MDRELKEDGKVETTESLAEWAYGLYEGLLPGEIRQGRRERGLEGDWNIWRDGCEGGEYDCCFFSSFMGLQMRKSFGFRVSRIWKDWEREN